MSNLFYSSKEEIRNRIIKKAQSFWGINKVYDFDPIITLLLEVISSEIFNVTNDIKDIENRIYDKISRILAPDYLIAPLPAHAIVLYQPSEEEVRISPYQHMLLKKRHSSTLNGKNEQILEIQYSALCDHRLFPGHVKYLATPNTMYEVSANLKRNIGRSIRQDSSRYIYLGIESFCKNGGTKYFEGLDFYFDWGNYQVDKDTYKLLNLGKWYLNEIPIQHFQNRFLQDSEGQNGRLFEGKLYLKNLIRDIEAYYQHHFMTISNIPLDAFEMKPTIPEIVRRNFDDRVLQSINTNLDWIRIELPNSISTELLEELHVQINAFPVVNKRLEEGVHRLKILKNVIPIETKDFEQLLTIEDLIDKEGHSYSEIPYSNNSELHDVGYYTLRHGGVERLDSRSAKDVVDYLFELIRDEKAAFSVYNADFLNTIMRDMEQNISLVKQKIKSRTDSIQQLKNYIIMNPRDEGDLVFSKIWLTYAEIANGSSVGSQLYLSPGSVKNYEHITFLTNTKGGRSKLNRSDSVQAFKYGLTTGDRIVSKNDILNFVKLEFGMLAKNITLKNGVAFSTELTKGFYKTLDIVVEVHDIGVLSNQEWSDLKNQCLEKLNVRSIIEANYRVEIV